MNSRREEELELTWIGSARLSGHDWSWVSVDCPGNSFNSILSEV